MEGRFAPQDELLILLPKIHAFSTTTMFFMSNSFPRSYSGWSLLTYHRTFAGVVLDSREGTHIANALGNNKAALLGNHGLLTVGQSIEETVAYFVLLDKCCEVQLAADASSAGSGKPLVKIGDMEAQATWEAIGTHASGYCELFHLPDWVAFSNIE